MDWYRSVRVPVKASKKRRWVFIIMDCMGKQKGAGNELSEVLAGFIILVFYLSITWSLIPPCAPDVHRKCAEICENKSQMRRADSHSTPLHRTAHMAGNRKQDNMEGSAATTRCLPPAVPPPHRHTRSLTADVPM